jgi:hypothetical protein
MLNNGDGDGAQIATIEELQGEIDGKLNPGMLRVWCLEKDEPWWKKVHRLFPGSGWRHHRFSFSALRETMSAHARFVAEAINTEVYKGPGEHKVAIMMEISPDEAAQVFAIVEDQSARVASFCLHGAR